MARSVRVAVWGCGHGELDTVFASIESMNARAADGRPIELLVCCGDFQAARNPEDLECMSCPPKYRAMRTFYKYYSGEQLAPVLTIFVGGNHEASNHMQELPYGGWVAPRIYYMGTSGVVNFRGLRIAGMSGIYKRYDFNTGYHERAPYSDDSVRSVFHVREFDCHKMQQVSGCVDVMVSHDWPEGVYNHGDTAALLRQKKHFREEVAAGKLGNPAHAQLLAQLQPRYWFAGHLHVKFAALVQHGAAGHQRGHGSGSSSANEEVASSVPSSSSSSAASAGHPDRATRFLALDKCLPGRAYLQVTDIPVRGPPHDHGTADHSSFAAGPTGGDATCDSSPVPPACPPPDPACVGLAYDEEWLVIVARTHWYMPTSKRYPPLPRGGPPVGQREREELRAAMRARMAPAAAAAAAAASAPAWPPAIPCNFVPTVPPYQQQHADDHRAPPRVPMPCQRGNPQSDAFLAMLGLAHNGVTVPWHRHHDEGGAAAVPATPTVPSSLSMSADASSSSSSYASSTGIAGTRVRMSLPPPRAPGGHSDASICSQGVPSAGSSAVDGDHHDGHHHHQKEGGGNSASGGLLLSSSASSSTSESRSLPPPVDPAEIDLEE